MDVRTIPVATLAKDVNKNVVDNKLEGWLVDLILEEFPEIEKELGETLLGEWTSYKKEDGMLLTKVF